MKFALRTLRRSPLFIAVAVLSLALDRRHSVRTEAPRRFSIDVSKKQIEANRRNARNSTGPRTAEGKSVVSANPIRHGLRSSDVVLDTEDRAEFEALRDTLVAEHQPEGPAGCFLVDAMAVAAWKLRRVHRAEAGFFMHRSKFDSDAHVARGFRRDKAEVAKAAVAVVACRNQKFLEFTARLQARLERSWFRALHELERRRAARDGHPVPPPVALDLDLHSDGD